MQFLPLFSFLQYGMALSSSLNLHNFGTLEDYMLVSIQNFLPFEFVGYFLMIMFRFLFWVEISQIIYIYIYIYLGASLVAQMIKNLPAMWKTQVQSLGWEDPIEQEMATDCSILLWEISEEPGQLPPWGHKESDMTELWRFIYLFIYLAALHRMQDQVPQPGIDPKPPAMEG